MSLAERHAGDACAPTGASSWSCRRWHALPDRWRLLGVVLEAVALALGGDHVEWWRSRSRHRRGPRSAPGRRRVPRSPARVSAATRASSRPADRGIGPLGRPSRPMCLLSDDDDQPRLPSPCAAIRSFLGRRLHARRSGRSRLLGQHHARFADGIMSAAVRLNHENRARISRKPSS
jgi:hypothetical protein